MTIRALHDVPAPAKLNLHLHIVGRRADGYHLLDSTMVLIDWVDMLHFEVRADGRLQRCDLGPALPADDLCLRAARALQQASGCALGVDIGVDKRVPMYHGRKFLDAVKPHNTQVEWIEYQDEGHGWGLPKNRVDFWSRVEKFLDKHIGPAAAR